MQILIIMTNIELETYQNKSLLCNDTCGRISEIV